MFKNPFSFKGRIARTEYILSYIIGYVSGFILGFLIGFLSLFLSLESKLEYLITFITMIPIYWFILAQGAKRCHDRGNSGWYQIIPFYILWMLFADSKDGINKYGPSPKITETK